MAQNACFLHFDLYFAPQRRAIFRHRNFKKWPKHAVFCTCSLANVLLATVPCNFSTSGLQKVLRTRQCFNMFTCKCASRYSGVQFLHIRASKSAPSRSVFYILTYKCASRYSGVQFFHIRTSKNGPNMQCFVHFDLEMYFSLQRHAIFPHRNFQKWSETVRYLRTRRFTEPTFRPSRPRNH